MTETTLKWLEQWFNSRNPGVNLDSNSNFYEQGLVDSFGIIEFIDDMEDHFCIQFNDDEFKLESFKTINGLVKIIESK